MLDELETIIQRINQLEAWDTFGKSLQEKLAVQAELSTLRQSRGLLEHNIRIKNKIESGSAIDKSIIDREAIKELNNKEAHSKAKVAKTIEHKILNHIKHDIDYSTVIVDATNKDYNYTYVLEYCNSTHLYIICRFESLDIINAALNDNYIQTRYQYVHTFKYSSKSVNPKIGFKEHFEYILYVNIGNKPVNHLLPNVIESSYEKDSRNVGLYTNLLLRSVQAGDTILGINITNGNLIKAAQAMLCSTVIVPVDSIASRECEKTIKELQFK